MWTNILKYRRLGGNVPMYKYYLLPYPKSILSSQILDKNKNILYYVKYEDFSVHPPNIPIKRRTMKHESTKTYGTDRGFSCASRQSKDHSTKKPHPRLQFRIPNLLLKQIILMIRTGYMTPETVNGLRNILKTILIHTCSGHE